MFFDVVVDVVFFWLLTISTSIVVYWETCFKDNNNNDNDSNSNSIQLNVEHFFLFMTQTFIVILSLCNNRVFDILSEEKKREKFHWMDRLQISSQDNAYVDCFCMPVVCSWPLWTNFSFFPKWQRQQWQEWNHNSWWFIFKFFFCSFKFYYMRPVSFFITFDDDDNSWNKTTTRKKISIFLEFHYRHQLVKIIMKSFHYWKAFEMIMMILESQDFSKTEKKWWWWWMNSKKKAREKSVQWISFEEMWFFKEKKI